MVSHRCDFWLRLAHGANFWVLRAIMAPQERVCGLRYAFKGSPTRFQGPFLVPFGVSGSVFGFLKPFSRREQRGFLHMLGAGSWLYVPSLSRGSVYIC